MTSHAVFRIYKQQLSNSFPSVFSNYENWKILSTLLNEKKENFNVVFVEAVVQACSKFTGKHLCQSLLFNKVAGNFIKEDTLAQAFSCEFHEISQKTFSTEHLCTTASIFVWCVWLNFFHILSLADFYFVERIE